MELLSPAGSFPALCSAVENGADAVYFGGSLFNARLGAQNFDEGEMKDALDYCRISGVKSFITMNTLTHTKDLCSALEYAAFLYENGADALIIQDLGLFSLIKKHIPDFELHASTQMCISTLEGVEMCKKLGFSRAVLSRELSLADITYICKNSDMPIEVFVHGAMCMSFSGGCLFSSMAGGRSGNCGSCAQPCRKYAAIDHIPNKQELALSLSDLCMIEHTDKLKAAGVMSLKIEGRMKKPEYIAAVTHAYRRALDGADSAEIQELKAEMFEVFNRGEFSTGYYFGDNAKTDRIAKSSPSPSTLEKIRRRNCCDKDTISLSLSAECGKAALLYVQSRFGSVAVSGEIVQEAKNPITEQTENRAVQQLKKLGGTGYTAGNVTAKISGFLPISAINEMRRRAIELLDEKKVLRRTAPNIPREIIYEKHKSSIQKYVSAHVFTTEQAYAAQGAGADEIVLEYGAFSAEEIRELQVLRKSAALYMSLPITLLKPSYEQMKAYISPSDFDGIEINNLGQLEFAKSFAHVTGGYHLNVFNIQTAQLLLSLGIERLTLSVELNPAQIREIQECIPPEKLALHVFGRVVLMNLYHCPIKEHIGCSECKKEWHTLYDAEGRAFPIVGTRYVNPCVVTRLYNCNAHDIIPKLEKIHPACYSLVFTKEKPDTVKERIYAALNGGDALADTTRGYFNR